MNQQAVAENGNLPEKKITAGAISATIWKNYSQNSQGTNTYYTVSFRRSYKDKQGIWQTTSTLGLQDLPKAQLVLQKAYEYLVLKAVEDTGQHVPVDQI